MAEWEVQHLGEIAQLRMGQSPRGPLVKELDSGLPFLQGNGEFGTRFPMARFECDDAPRRSAPGDSLISVRAPVGDINRSDRGYGIGRGLAAVTFKSVDSDFGHYAIIECSRHLDRTSQGTTFSAIGRAELAALQVPVPPLEEQRRIAEILDTIDETIQATERVIVKRKKIRAGLATSLLSGGVVTEAGKLNETPPLPGSTSTSRSLVMRESRDYVTLRELAELNPESLGAKTPADYTFKYIDLSSVNWGSIDMASVRQVRFADAPSRARRVVREGDVLFGTVRPQLRSHAKVKGDGFVASTGFCVTRPKPGRADSGFLGHYLLSDEANRQVARREVGSNYPAVTEGDVGAFELPHMPLEEQRRIAEILDTIDETIQATERVIDKRKKIRSGVAVSLLSGGVVTEDWMTTAVMNDVGFTSVPLAEVADFINGYAFGPADWDRSGLPIVRIQQLLNPAAVADFFSGSLDSRYRIDTGDLVMSWSGTIAVVEWERGPAWLNQHLFRVDAKAGVEAGFLKHLLDSRLGHLEAASHGMTMKHVKRGDLLKHEVSLPPLEEQRRIAEILDTIDATIRANEQQRDKLFQVRSGLASDLLSGRVRTVAA